ncbi:hypothetical protein EG68_09508 [Paragonimus skrjabini miyazakii]|uniref:Uncharacterized protein n=1 Tax=Paragonimus skrjabini miyazakii TaxID=59628 RepID=A0A8S9YQI8_9TREM|nr:hypothetical protein EG68_09508 [Paragonimus skrjabini miyazakii]
MEITTNSNGHRLLHCRMTHSAQLICSDLMRYPRMYFKVVRKNKLKPTTENLKRLAESYLQTASLELARLRSAHQQLSSVVDSLNPFCRITFTLFACSALKKTRESHCKRLQLSISNEDMISSSAPNLDHYVRNLWMESFTNHRLKSSTSNLLFLMSR